MIRKALGNGAIYEIPGGDIEYIGYFYGTGGNEDLNAAYKRVSLLRGRAPDFLTNCELFNFNTRRAASDVVSAGEIHRLSEGFGMAFPGNAGAVFCYKNSIQADDYIGFYPTLIRGGEQAFSGTPSGLGGRRGRTAIAVGEGAVFLALIPDGSGGMTLEELAAALIAAGATDGGNLDGGGSSQWYSPGGRIYTGRALRGFIGIWLKEGKRDIETRREACTVTENLIPKGKANRPGGVNALKYITVHETGNSAKGADAKAHASYLKNTSDKVSWHYTVDEHGAYRHIPDSERAFHAGDTVGNTQSIGVEICVNRDGDFDKAVKNAAALVRELMAKYSIPVSNVVQHNYWNRKDCPKNLRKSGWDAFKLLCGGGEEKAIGAKTVSVKTVLNIRKSPPNALGINLSTVIGSYKNRESVFVYEYKNGWWRTPRGWCSGKYLK